MKLCNQMKRNEMHNVNTNKSHRIKAIEMYGLCINFNSDEADPNADFSKQT